MAHLYYLWIRWSLIICLNLIKYFLKTAQFIRFSLNLLFWCLGLRCARSPCAWRALPERCLREIWGFSSKNWLLNDFTLIWWRVWMGQEFCLFGRWNHGCGHVFARSRYLTTGSLRYWCLYRPRECYFPLTLTLFLIAILAQIQC